MPRSRPPISDLEDHLGFWLRSVSNHVSYAFARKVEALGVTVAEWAVLRALYDSDEAAPSDVAARLGMTRGAISKLVDRLAAKKLVARRSGGADKRYQSLSLTPAGAALTPRLAALADRNDAAFFAALAPVERAALLKALRTLAAAHGFTSTPTD